LERLDNDDPKGERENEKSISDKDNNDRVPSIDSTSILEELDRLNHRMSKPK
jgi:hypothetical protein